MCSRSSQLAGDCCGACQDALGVVTVARFERAACDHCEESHPRSEFREEPGWWSEPAPDIEWADFDGTISGPIFARAIPVEDTGWFCPCGCLTREEPEWYEPDDPQEYDDWPETLVRHPTREGDA